MQGIRTHWACLDLESSTEIRIVKYKRSHVLKARRSAVYEVREMEVFWAVGESRHSGLEVFISKTHKSSNLDQSSEPFVPFILGS